MVRMFVVVLSLVLGTGSNALSQAPSDGSVPDWTGIRPPVLAEHATGGEIPMLIGGASFTGMVIYDIATAPASARWYNERHPEHSRKSPQNALLLSVASTAVPFVIGAVTYERTLSAGDELAFAGLVLGPSVGHWYAGRPRRALKTAGLRAGLGLFTAYMYACCT